MAEICAKKTPQIGATESGKWITTVSTPVVYIGNSIFTNNSFLENHILEQKYMF